MKIRMAVQSLCVALVFPALAAAQPATFKADPVHSKVGFSIRHIVSEVDGRFKDFDGAITYDAKHPEGSAVQFTVQAVSIAISLFRCPIASVGRPSWEFIARRRLCTKKFHWHAWHA